MALVLSTNTTALVAQHALDQNQRELKSTGEKLATGKRIVHSGDDPAGLSIANHLDAELRGAQAAQRNAMSGNSVLQVAEGGLNEVSNLVLRIRELAMQSASDTVGEKERNELNREAQELKSEVDRQANSARFGDLQLLNGNGHELTFQVGSHNTEFDRISYNPGQNDVRASALGIDGIDVSDADSARTSLEKLDKSLDTINSARASIGSSMARLNSASDSLQTYETNLAEAHSRVMDADYGVETAKYARYQILAQAGAAVLSQANQEPALALKLLSNL